MDFANLHLDLNIQTINDIKRLLICRDPSYKIIAAEEILKNINCSKNPKGLIELLINADIIELLCEASCTTNLKLLQLIFKCILKFIDNKKFYEQRHTTFTFEYILRTLHVLLQLNEGKESFIYGLQLVGILISRLNQLNIYLNEVCNISNIVNLLKHIFTNNQHPSVILTATEVIIYILQSNTSVPINMLFVKVASQALEFLIDVIQRAISKKCISVTAELINNSMRFIINKEGNINLDDLCEDLLMKLYLALKGVLVPVLIETNIYHGDLELVNILLRSILSIYYSPDEKVSRDFSEHLVTKGILNFLPQLEIETGNEDTVVLIRSILFELLVCLSQYILGQEDWKSLLSPGLVAQPFGLPYSKIFLCGQDIIIPLASIVYNYFNLIVFTSPIVDFDFLKNVSKYILLLRKKPSNPILKALWILFTIAYLCNGDNCPQSKDPMMKIIQYLMTSDLKLIYTHHPAILYWSFSDSIIPQELQAKVVILWIGHNEEQNSAEILSLMKKNKESTLLIMEVMPLCETKISFIILNILSSVIEGEDGMRWEDIYEHAWSLLPTCFAKYSSNPEAFYYESIATLIKICCDFIPENVDLALTLRISCLLPGAFYKYFVMTYRSRVKDTLMLNEEETNTVIVSLNLAGCLLNVGNQNNDSRVASSLLGHDEFLTSVEFFLAANNENITVAVMNLLVYLVKYQKKLNHQHNKVIELEGMKLLKFLQGGVKLSIAVLEFLACYLEALPEKSVSSIIKIPQPTALQLRALYLHIHMICSKSDESTARFCWRCLKRLLELSESMGIQEHFAMLPYTLGLLTKTSENSLCGEAATFISIWLKFLPTYFPRSHSIPMSLKVVQHLIKKLDKVKHGTEFFETLTKAALLGKPENNYNEEAGEENPQD